jgi:hypothetical protein
MVVRTRRSERFTSGEEQPPPSQYSFRDILPERVGVDAYLYPVLNRRREDERS